MYKITIGGLDQDHLNLAFEVRSEMIKAGLMPVEVHLKIPENNEGVITLG